MIPARHHDPRETSGSPREIRIPAGHHEAPDLQARSSPQLQASQSSPLSPSSLSTAHPRCSKHEYPRRQREGVGPQGRGATRNQEGVSPPRGYKGAPERQASTPSTVDRGAGPSGAGPSDLSPVICTTFKESDKKLCTIYTSIV